MPFADGNTTVQQKDIMKPREGDLLSVVLLFQTVQCHLDARMVTTLVIFAIIEAGIANHRSILNNGTDASGHAREVIQSQITRVIKMKI